MTIPYITRSPRYPGKTRASVQHRTQPKQERLHERRTHGPQYQKDIRYPVGTRAPTRRRTTVHSPEGYKISSRNKSAYTTQDIVQKDTSQNKSAYIAQDPRSTMEEG